MNQNGQYQNGQFQNTPQGPQYQGQPIPPQPMMQPQGQPYPGPQYQIPPQTPPQTPPNNGQFRGNMAGGPDPRYQEPTFEQYCADPQAPRSFQVLISSALKARVKGYVKSIPRMLLTMIPFTILTMVFNIFFWSVINDTMWAGRGTWGRISFMPYLIGGAVYEGTRYKGVTPFEVAGLTPTGKLVAPLTFALSLLFSRLIMRRKQGGTAAISRDFASVKDLRNHYEKALSVAPRPSVPKMNRPAAPNMPYGQTVPGMQGNIQGNPNMPYNQGNQNTAYDEAINNAVNSAKVMATTNGYIDLSNLSNNIYMRIGLCCAIIFGFIIRNPFAVPVFALLLYYSFGQGGESDIGQMFFRIRSADGKLYDGRKQIPPKYSEGMLIMYYMSIGLFMYTAVNIILWFLFNYNYYIRFIVSGALVAAIFVLGGGGKKQIAGMVSSILFIVGGFSLFCAVTVFADDNGWSESGRTLSGLMNNNGFPKALLSSLIPALFWDIGILLGWPLEFPFLPFGPGNPGYLPPQPPVNPYDFEGRPQGWKLNDEGDVTFTDPVTGKPITYGLTGYDENGNGIYIGPNGSYYGQEELINNYNNALEHQDYFQDAYKTQQRNVAEQQAMNHAQWEKERQTGETEASRLYKQDQERLKHEEYKEKLFEKYGTSDEKEIKKKIKEQQIKDGIEYDKQMAKEAVLKQMEDYAQKVETVADITINVLGEYTGPVGKSIKNAYNFAKPGLTTFSTSLAEGKDALDVFRDVSLTVSNSMLDYAKGNSKGVQQFLLTLAQPALVNGAKAYIEGKDALDIAEAVTRGVTDSALDFIKDNTEGPMKYLTGLSTDSIKAGLDAYSKGENVGDAMAKNISENLVNKAIDMGLDYVGDKVTNYANDKLTGNLQKQVDNINKYRSTVGVGDKHAIKKNMHLQNLANERMKTIKNIKDGTSIIKDLSKEGYKKYLESTGNVGDIGDMVVSGRQVERNNLFNTGQGLGMKYRKMTGYRKKP